MFCLSLYIVLIISGKSVTGHMVSNKQKLLLNIKKGPTTKTKLIIINLFKLTLYYIGKVSKYKYYVNILPLREFDWQKPTMSSKLTNCEKRNKIWIFSFVQLLNGRNETERSLDATKLWRLLAKCSTKEQTLCY